MSYKVLGMLHGSGLTKDMTSGIAVPYKTVTERRDYAVAVLPSSGQLRWRGGAVHTLGKTFLYVMDGDGNIYTASDHEVQHHSAFLAGQPAAAAGIWVADRGFLISINADSGHYQLPGDYCQQIITELAKRGVRTNNVNKDFGHTLEQRTRAMKRMVRIEPPKHWWQSEKGARVVQDYVEGVTRGSAENPVRIESGTHIAGQRMRLYPGKKPEWGWS